MPPEWVSSLSGFPAWRVSRVNCASYTIFVFQNEIPFRRHAQIKVSWFHLQNWLHRLRRALNTLPALQLRYTSATHSAKAICQTSRLLHAYSSGAFHLPQNFGHFGTNWNGKARFGSFWPEYSGLPLEVVHFHRLDRNSTFHFHKLVSCPTSFQQILGCGPTGEKKAKWKGPWHAVLSENVVPFYNSWSGLVQLVGLRKWKAPFISLLWLHQLRILRTPSKTSEWAE